MKTINIKCIKNIFKWKMEFSRNVSRKNFGPCILHLSFNCFRASFHYALAVLHLALGLGLFVVKTQAQAITSFACFSPNISNTVRMPPTSRNSAKNLCLEKNVQNVKILRLKKIPFIQGKYEARCFVLHM